MKVNGTYTFPAPADDVWDLLLDPDVLMQVIPGLESVNIQPDGNILATATVGVGPVKGKFNGKLQLLEQQKPTHVKVVGEGKGGPGFMKGTCIIDAVEQDAATLIHYQADVQLGGTLASVGQRLVDAATNSVMQQGFERFNRVLGERHRAAALAQSEQETTMTSTHDTPVHAASAHEDQHDQMFTEIVPNWMAWALGIALVLLGLVAYFSHF
ncbi:MAG: carbon monoxide dehydrogenase subunit G [Chloroflexi bacterium]|nr:carbon monoxide dehydrogenase subunit G [Chloroflexota bacterium]